MMPVAIVIVLFHMIKKSCCSSFCLNVRNVVVPFSMLMASCDVNIRAIGMAWLEIHVAPQFNHLDLRNAMVPFRMPSTSYAAYVNAIMAAHDQNVMLHLISIILT